MATQFPPSPGNEPQKSAKPSLFRDRRYPIAAVIWVVVAVALLIAVALGINAISNVFHAASAQSDYLHEETKELLAEIRTSGLPEETRAELVDEVQQVLAQEAVDGNDENDTVDEHEREAMEQAKVRLLRQVSTKLQAELAKVGPVRPSSYRRSASQTDLAWARVEEIERKVQKTDPAWLNLTRKTVQVSYNPARDGLVKIIPFTLLLKSTEDLIPYEKGGHVYAEELTRNGERVEKHKGLVFYGSRQLVEPQPVMHDKYYGITSGGDLFAIGWDRSAGPAPNVHFQVKVSHHILSSGFSVGRGNGAPVAQFARFSIASGVDYPVAESVTGNVKVLWVTSDGLHSLVDEFYLDNEELVIRQDEGRPLNVFVAIAPT